MVEVVVSRGRLLEMRNDDWRSPHRLSLPNFGYARRYDMFNGWGMNDIRLPPLRLWVKKKSRLADRTIEKVVGEHLP